LQAIKKGVMELADLVVINKADIDAIAAQRAQLQITSAMQLLGMFSGYVETNWHPKAIQLSALKGEGVEAFWAEVQDFKARQTANGKLSTRRQQQSLSWMWERIDAGLKLAFKQDPAVSRLLPELLAQVASGHIPASTAARNLLAAQSNRAQAATE
jgi:LAO/AO transport system kinase